MQRRRPVYDKGQDSHYNLISALHKSLRGSDADAALYWFERMLAGGEDPNYIARRLTRFAVEDIGLADPQAMTHALNAWQVYERLGSPEGDLALANTVLYLATAPKSNAAYVAHKAGLKTAQRTGSLPPPKTILNAPTSMMKDLGYGADYSYDHDAEDGFSGQNYFPEGMNREQLYNPVERGFERDIRKRLEYWARLRERRNQTGDGGRRQQWGRDLAMIWLSVALGGALGACLRYAMFLSIGTVGGFPLATFAANAGGSLALGFLAALFRLGTSGPMSWDSPLRLFLLVGVLGALTTFSTFALEAVDALRAGRVGLALLYVSATLVITVAGCWIGYLLGQAVGSSLGR